jgi:hypothetical protein
VNAIRNFWTDDRSSFPGQLVESTLLLAFVAVGSSAIFLQAHPNASLMDDAQFLLRATIAGE